MSKRSELVAVVTVEHEHGKKPVISVTKPGGETVRFRGRNQTGKEVSRLLYREGFTKR